MVLHHECFHIRKSADRSLFAAPRSLSQLVTSFVGSWCQGIHLMLLFAWTSFWISSAVLFELLEFLWTLFGFLFAVKRFDPFYVFLSVRMRLFISTLEIVVVYPNFLERPILISLLKCVLFYLFVSTHFTSLFGFQWSFPLLNFSIKLVGSSGLEPPTSRLSGARSNHLSYEPIKLFDVSRLSRLFFTAFRRWWRWWDSNPWPPACRAGALPTELHPLFFSKGFLTVTENWTTIKISTWLYTVLRFSRL